MEGVDTYSSVTGLWSNKSSEWSGQGGGWGIWGSPERGRALVNGKLHILTYQVGIDVFEIVAVDSQGRTCRVIEWPDERMYPNVGFIGQSQGRLHCVSPLYEGTTKSYGPSIWVLEDYNTEEEEWVLKHSLSLWHLFEGVDPLDFFLL